MSQENVEIVRRLNAEFNAGNWDAAFALFHPEVEFRDLRPAPDLPEVVRGIDALALVLRNWAGAYDGLGVVAYEYIDADPWVVVDACWHGEGKGSAVPLVDPRQADACKVEDGKIVALVVAYPDVPAALEALEPEK